MGKRKFLICEVATGPWLDECNCNLLPCLSHLDLPPFLHNDFPSIPKYDVNINLVLAFLRLFMLGLLNSLVAGSIPNGVTGIFQWLNPSGRIVAIGSTQPLTEMSTRNPSWG
jgi:hypothetical protein